MLGILATCGLTEIEDDASLVCFAFISLGRRDGFCGFPPQAIDASELTFEFGREEGDTPQAMTADQGMSARMSGSSSEFTRLDSNKGICW